jgi:NADPH-dependent 2,4-dienoyl-CoA reductase/sulfur reductase-like enzyme/rhodanese-related sulfurtransferase
MKVLIVGMGAGGVSAAARLRRLDEHCEIILFEKGDHISIAKCGMPYYIGEVITDEKKLVETPEALKQTYNIDIRVFSEVTAIDRAKKSIKVRYSKGDQEYIETYDKLILSPGALPIVPRIEGANAPNVFVLRKSPDALAIKDFLDQKKPKKAVVVGGGFIGLEIAENLHRRGITVTIVELLDQVLGSIDYEMALLVDEYLWSKGVELHLGDGIKAIHHNQKNSVVELSSGKRIETDMIVMGIGVHPENGLAKDTGLELGERGGIKVDKTLRTSDPDIYAVGDAIEVIDFVNGNPTLIYLAGPANRQGRIAANNIYGANEEYARVQGTTVLKVFDMTVAFTGNNEKVLTGNNIPYQKSFTHSTSHVEYYPDWKPISIKLIFSPEDGKILGAQAVGYEGTEKRLDVIATAMRAGMTVFDLEKLELSYAPPFSSVKDPVNVAGYVAANMLKGNVEIIHWHEIGKLDRDKFILVDVRTEKLYRQGAIDGAVNIPLDDLRERVNEFPRDKGIIVYCQRGRQSYLAYKILTQRGYQNVRSLSGGYKTYSGTLLF